MGIWRFLVHEKQQRKVSSDGVVKEPAAYVPIAGASTAATDAAKYELTELKEGSLVKGFEEAVRAAEGLLRVRDGGFEALFLIMPAVHVTAL
jgi:hypothetical protein